MARARHILAIFIFSKSIAKFINDANAFRLALGKAAENNLVTVPPEKFTEFDEKMKELTALQAHISKRRKGHTGMRDHVLWKAKNMVRGFVRIVQQAADKAGDVPESIAIIRRCGLRERKERVITKATFEVRRDEKHPGRVYLISKAAHKNLKAVYIWEVSRNGVNFTIIKVTTRSKTSWQTDVRPSTKLTFRRGIVTNKSDGMPSWSQSVTLFIT